MKLFGVTALLVLSASVWAQQWDSGSGLGWEIPDAGPEVEWSFNPVGVSGTVVGFDVFMQPFHTWRSDLFIHIIDPTGQALSLHQLEGEDSYFISCYFSDTGNSLGNVEDLDSTTTSLTYQPSGGMLSWLSFGGGGTWRLRAQDIAEFDVGTIDRIRMRTSAVPEQGASVAFGIGLLALALRRTLLRHRDTGQGSAI